MEAHRNVKNKAGFNVGDFFRYGSITYRVHAIKADAVYNSEAWCGWVPNKNVVKVRS